MKIDLIGKTQIKQIVRDEVQTELKYIYNEINKLHERVRELREEIALK